MKDLIKNYEELLESESYNNYIKENPNAFLFACFLANGEWQFDFYLNGKVIVFKNEKPVMKDEILNPSEETKELDLNKVKIKVEKAIEIAREELRLHKDETDKRIVLLQNIKNKATWNITLLTKQMNMLNVKVDAETGKINGESFQSIFKMKK